MPSPQTGVMLIWRTSCDKLSIFFIPNIGCNKSSRRSGSGGCPVRSIINMSSQISCPRYWVSRFVSQSLIDCQGCCPQILCLKRPEDEMSMIWELLPARSTSVLKYKCQVKCIVCSMLCIWVRDQPPVLSCTTGIVVETLNLWHLYLSKSIQSNMTYHYVQREFRIAWG